MSQRQPLAAGDKVTDGQLTGTVLEVTGYWDGSGRGRGHWREQVFVKWEVPTREEGDHEAARHESITD